MVDPNKSVGVEAKIDAASEDILLTIGLDKLEIAALECRDDGWFAATVRSLAGSLESANDNYSFDTKKSNARLLLNIADAIEEHYAHNVDRINMNNLRKYATKFLIYPKN